MTTWRATWPRPEPLPWTLLEDYMGVTVVTNNVRPLIGNQTTPLVEVIAGQPRVLVTVPAVAGSLTVAVRRYQHLRWCEYCSAPASVLLSSSDPNGTGDYGFAAATLNVMGSGPSKAVSMPVDLMYVYTDPSAPGNDLPAVAHSC